MLLVINMVITNVSSSWWDFDWDKCKELTFTELSNVTRINYPVNLNLTDLVFVTTDEIRIINQSCNGDGGVEFPYQVITNGSDWVDVTILVNATQSDTTVYALYYNNTGATLPSYEWNLITFYPSESNTVAIDKSGSGLDGVVTGATLNVSEGFNNSNSYWFDGTDDYTDAGDSSIYDSQFVSWGAWVYRTGAFGAGDGIVTKKKKTIDPYEQFSLQEGISGGYGYNSFGFNEHALCQIGVGNNNYFTAGDSFPMAIDSWVHLFCTANTTNLTYYKNGAYHDSESVNDTLGYDDSEFMVGADDPVLWNGEFTGYIDEVMVFNKTLSSDEVQSLSGFSKLVPMLNENETIESNVTVCGGAYVSGDFTLISNTICTNETFVVDGFINTGTYTLSLFNSIIDVTTKIFGGQGGKIVGDILSKLTIL